MLTCKLPCDLTWTRAQGLALTYMTLKLDLSQMTLVLSAKHPVTTNTSSEVQNCL